MEATSPRERLLILAAFGAIYFIWGSTYLVNYFAIQDIPPFLMSGIRFGIAGSLLLAVSLFLGQPWPTAEHWKYGFITGFLFLALGTGLVVWAEQFIDTGLVALFVAFQPLVIVLMVWIRRGQRPAWNSFFGVALGVVGMILLVGQPKLIAGHQTWWGIAAIAIGILSWAFASLYVTEVNLPASRMQASAMQMVGAGIVLTLAGLLTGEGAAFDLAAVSLRGWLSFLYLIFAGSILAFSAFNYLLVRVAPERVSTSNYVNPVVAMFLGWAFNNEQVSGQSILAAGLLLGGVLFINSRFVRGRSEKGPLLKGVGNRE